MTTTGLTPKERALLAREVAADGMRISGVVRDLEGECEECSCTVFVQPPDTDYREAFNAGWDAAMEYVRQREQELLLDP
jgi:hypothetical protein